MLGNSVEEVPPLSVSLEESRLTSSQVAVKASPEIWLVRHKP
jgi:hypothetical protein